MVLSSVKACVKASVKADSHVGFFRRVRFRGVIFKTLEEEQEDSSLRPEVPSEDFVGVIGFVFDELRFRKMCCGDRVCFGKGVKFFE